MTPGIPIAQVALTNGAGEAVWEWVGAPQPNQVQTLEFGVVLAMALNVGGIVLTAAAGYVISLALRLVPTVLWATALYGMYTYLGVGLSEAGFSSARIAVVISFYGCGAIVGVLLGGRAADLLGAKPTSGSWTPSCRSGPAGPPWRSPCCCSPARCRR